jgi:hypothetical protein
VRTACRGQPRSATRCRRRSWMVRASPARFAGQLEPGECLEEALRCCGGPPFPVLPVQRPAQRQVVRRPVDFDDAVSRDVGRQGAHHGAEGGSGSLFPGEDVIGTLAEHKRSLRPGESHRVPGSQPPGPLRARSARVMVKHAQLDAAVALPDGIGAQHVSWPQPVTRVAQVGHVHAHVLAGDPGQPGNVVAFDPDSPHAPGDLINLRDLPRHREPVTEPSRARGTRRSHRHANTI